MAGGTALYARISKVKAQNIDTQRIELEKWAKDSGTPDATLYVDELSSRDTRPRKEEVLRLARLGLINRIVVVRLDRWGRSLDELVPELQELSGRGVEFLSLREGLRFDTAAGRLHGHMLAAFANFERDLIQERTLAGLERARRQGKTIGRHPPDCGCGATPKGRQPHTGPTLPVRDERNMVIGWRKPDGTVVGRKGHPNPLPQTEVGSASVSPSALTPAA